MIPPPALPPHLPPDPPAIVRQAKVEMRKDEECKRGVGRVERAAVYYELGEALQEMGDSAAEALRRGEEFTREVRVLGERAAAEQEARAKRRRRQRPVRKR